MISIFTVVFLEIHPFQDGDGRLSRVLTTLLLLRAGYAYVPYSSLESVVERNKERYYLALRQTQEQSAQLLPTRDLRCCFFFPPSISRCDDSQKKWNGKSWCFHACPIFPCKSWIKLANMGALASERSSS